jgi:hypothetical protein
MNIKFAKTLHGNNKVIKLYERSNGREFLNECLRYGIIISDGKYECKDVGSYYEGFNRTYEILYGGLICKIRMQNGEVKEHGCETVHILEKERILKIIDEQLCVK